MRILRMYVSSWRTTRARMLTVLLLLWRLQGAVAVAGVTFDGTSDRILTNVSTPFQFANTSFSVCFWHASTQTGVTTGLAHKATNVTAGPGGWAVMQGLSANKVDVKLQDASSTYTSRRATSTVVTDGVERHVCAVVTTSTTVAATNSTALYLNGQLDQLPETKSGLVYATTTNVLGFGFRDSGSSSFVGTLDDIRIDSPALNDQEIRHLAKSGLRGGGGLSHKAAGYWPLTECTHGATSDGVTFADHSGSGNPALGDTSGGPGLTCRASPLLRRSGWVQ